MLERLEPDDVEETHRGAVELRLPGTRAAPDLGDEVAQLEVGKHALAVDASHIFNARPRNRLLVGHYRKRLVRRLREPARNLRPKRAAGRGGVLRPGCKVHLVV